MTSKITHEEFLEELYKNNTYYKNGKFEVVGEYKRRSFKIEVKTQYGNCTPWASDLLKGSSVTIKSAIDKNKYCTNQFKEIHGEKYDYSLLEYVNSGDNLKIICNIHGVFECCAESHLGMGTGCPLCGRESSSKKRALTKEQFIERAVVIHGNKYDYSLVNYIKSHSEVDIICKEHEKSFRQKPNSHLNGNIGCRLCSNVDGYYTKENWCDKTKGKFGILYFLECFDEEEIFYKIGITTQTTKKRYNDSKSMPYSYKIIGEIKSSDKQLIWEEEALLKILLKGFKYKPKKYFRGVSECFDKKSHNIIYEEFKRLGFTE